MVKIRKQIKRDMNMKRYIVRLILWSLVVGAILGYLGGLTGVIRSAILFFLLSLGTLIVNEINRKNLDQQTTLNWNISLISGALCGIAAGVLIILTTSMLYTKPGYGIYFVRPIENNAFIVITTSIYGILLHGAYALRWKYMNKNWYLGLFLLAAIICNAARLIGESLNTQGQYYHPGYIVKFDPSLILPIVFTTLFTGVLTSIPFTFAWYAVQQANDPAWSFERWQSISNETNC